jgi:aldose 1-epimerase
MRRANESIPASGDQYVLRVGRYACEDASVGASLRTLTFDGRHLVLPWHADEVRPRYRGAVLAPWPNRVVDGTWQWRGETHQLPLNEPDLGHALHGLVHWHEWRATAVTETSVVLETDVVPQPGYPFRLTLSVRWTLGDDGLAWRLHARNAGADDAPYGCSIHPYLVAPGAAADEWVLHLPAGTEMLTDERKAPTSVVPVTAAHDFRRPRSIDDVEIDHAFTDIAFDQSGRGTVSLTDAAGRGARIDFGQQAPWIQVCTSDWPGQPGHRAGVAVEPMTCPPNALATGTDVVVLAPGAVHELELRISAVEPG